MPRPDWASGEMTAHPVGRKRQLVESVDDRTAQWAREREHGMITTELLESLLPTQEDGMVGKTSPIGRIDLLEEPHH